MRWTLSSPTPLTPPTPVISSPSWYHSTDGVGTPSAAHCSVTGSLRATVTSDGCSVIRGALPAVTSKKIFKLVPGLTNGDWLVNQLINQLINLSPHLHNGDKRPGHWRVNVRQSTLNKVNDNGTM